MTTYRDNSNPDGHDDRRDEADPLGPQEREILFAFFQMCGDRDWSYCRASFAIDAEKWTAQTRPTIRALVAKGYLKTVRGGLDEDGQVIGGTFYEVTLNGKIALGWTEPVRERAL